MQSSIPKNPDSEYILWLSALPVEIEALLSLLDVSAPISIGGYSGFHGYLRGRELFCFICGSGGEACRRALTVLLNRWPKAHVLLVGCAGALNPALKVGDVVIASHATSWPAQGEIFSPDQQLLGAVAEPQSRLDTPTSERGLGFRIFAGCILSWHELVKDALHKQQLYETFEADCVDMETGSAAWSCAQRSVPFLSIRGISDQADNTVSELTSADLAQAVWHATLVAIEALREV